MKYIRPLPQIQLWHAKQPHWIVRYLHVVAKICAGRSHIYSLYALWSFVLLLKKVYALDTSVQYNEA